MEADADRSFARRSAIGCQKKKYQKYGLMHGSYRLEAGGGHVSAKKRGDAMIGMSRFHFNPALIEFGRESVNTDTVVVEPESSGSISLAPD